MTKKKVFSSLSVPQTKSEAEDNTLGIQTPKLNKITRPGDKSSFTSMAAQLSLNKTTMPGTTAGTGVVSGTIGSVTFKSREALQVVAKKRLSNVVPIDPMT